jgi:hypothetical protein
VGICGISDGLLGEQKIEFCLTVQNLFKLFRRMMSVARQGPQTPILSAVLLYKTIKKETASSSSSSSSSLGFTYISNTFYAIFLLVTWQDCAEEWCYLLVG